MLKMLSYILQSTRWVPQACNDMESYHSMMLHMLQRRILEPSPERTLRLLQIYAHLRKNGQEV